MITKGIILYNIELDGCLSGVYSNEDAYGEIFNEIARKNTYTSDDEICGIYNCLYFDSGNSQEETVLTIAAVSEKKEPIILYGKITIKYFLKG